MDDNPTGEQSERERAFIHQVTSKATRKLRVQRAGKQGVWFGLGMSGIIGWSVAVPTLAGALFGIWWDNRHPGTRSWTLMLMFAGLVIGCANAWYWIAQQDEIMHDQPEDKDD